MKTITVTLVLLFSLVFSTTAQITLNKDNANSIIMKCLKTIANSQADTTTYRTLADAYFLVNEMGNAANWYKHALLYSDFDSAIHYQNYAKALKALNQESEAEEMYSKAMSFNQQEEHHTLIKSPELFPLGANYKVVPLAINSEQMDFAPSFYTDKLIFSSSRIETGGAKNAKDKWTGQPYCNLYNATVSDNGEVDHDIALFTIEGSKGLHGSTTSFSKDGSTVYFTKEFFLNRKRGGMNPVFKIYQSRLENGKWRKAEELPFNTNHYSSAHPALSPDGKTLYFASDRVGSYGVSDIWMVKVFDDGRSFGLPEKLGSNINTKGKDSFPFVSASGKLYFSSNGHDGHGGMDVFVADITTASMDQAQVKNLGKPINSAADDITFILDEKINKGYFSSNREDGIDDIYSFSEIKSEVAAE